MKSTVFWEITAAIAATVTAKYNKERMGRERNQGSARMCRKSLHDKRQRKTTLEILQEYFLHENNFQNIA